MLLEEYAAILASLNCWNDVLRSTEEALRLTPNNITWLSLQQQSLAQLKISPYFAACDTLRSTGPTKREGVCDLVSWESDSQDASPSASYIRTQVEAISAVLPRRASSSVKLFQFIEQPGLLSECSGPRAF